MNTLVMDRTEDPYAPLEVIMKRYGASCSPREFYWNVNSAYHTAEARQYDELHTDMLEELPPVWRELLGHLPVTPYRLRVLDVGAGTGLVGEFLQETCRERVGTLVMLDPCKAMVGVASRKTLGWSFSSRCVVGDISAVRDNGPFDAITANSVLHHIVDLSEFCRAAQWLLRPGGVLLTAQDTRADAEHDPVLAERRRGVQDRLRPRLSARARGLAGRAIRRVCPSFHANPLAEGVNAALLGSGTITTPMSLDALWSVTDFHVPGQVGGFGHGISTRYMQQCMERMTLDLCATYHYHGVNWPMLTSVEKEHERELWSASDLHGEMVCMVWRKRG